MVTVIQLLSNSKVGNYVFIWGGGFMYAPLIIVFIVLSYKFLQVALTTNLHYYNLKGSAALLLLTINDNQWDQNHYFHEHFVKHFEHEKKTGSQAGKTNLLSLNNTYFSWSWKRFNTECFSSTSEKKVTSQTVWLIKLQIAIALRSNEAVRQLPSPQPLFTLFKISWSFFQFLYFFTSFFKHFNSFLLISKPSRVVFMLNNWITDNNNCSTTLTESKRLTKL